MSLETISRRLAREVDDLRFAPPVAYVYNPLIYAWESHRHYLGLFRDLCPRALLVGMNPGPWGMAQTGVPFGAVSLVRDWLGVEAPVGRPPREHPARPVEGFACAREEVSGSRLWGWARDRFGSPGAFLGRFHVANYCPLLFLDAEGRNLTPDRIRAADRQALLEPCDRALRAVAEELGAERVIGVGKFAEQRARAACAGLGVEVSRILHPSPASPRANRGWAEAAEGELQEQGVEI